MPHTPRLCIDGRAAADFPGRALLAQELIDQLVAAQGEGKGPGEWVEKQRTVLVTHPKQVFAGQLRRFETRRRIGRSPLYWVWEQHFAKNAQISAFHRFRPIGRLRPKLTLQTINTLIGSPSRLPRSLPVAINHRFVVPSRGDRAFLATRYHVTESRVSVVRPVIRRYVHFSPGPAASAEKGHLLLLWGSRIHPRLEKILGGRFPNLVVKSISLDAQMDFAPANWLQWLGKSSVCFYLDSSPFDWGTLFLESVYWRVPSIFDEKHAALAELLPNSALTLNRFLVDSPSLDALRLQTEASRAELASQGIFDPFSLAFQYADIYQTLLPVVDWTVPEGPNRVHKPSGCGAPAEAGT